MSMLAGLPIGGVLVALALAVLVLRGAGTTRDHGPGSLLRRFLVAWPAALAPPVGAVLLVVVAVSAGLTAAIEQLHRVAVRTGADASFDVHLLFLTGAVLAVVGCSLLVGLAGAAVAHIRGFGAGAVAGALLLAALAGGVAGALLPELWSGDLPIPFAIFLGTVSWALPWAVLGAALGSRGRRPEPSRDLWQLLLELATADLTHRRSVWGAAMRAELAAIDRPAERRSFALGAARAALWSAPSRETAWYVLGAVLVVAVGTWATSRWSLAHGAGGILGFWVFAPGLVLFVIAVATARRTGSFGSALSVAGLSGFECLVALLAVGIPEAVAWARPGGGYLTTGDAIPPSWQAAVMDLVRPEFLGAYVAVWTAMAACGAALGLAFVRPDRLPAGHSPVGEQR